ncbi:hypothetical protein M2119_000221 [Aurantimicrobium minutum]|nr:hypothetical protein [Aurantimicrobium minutum]
MEPIPSWFIGSPVTLTTMKRHLGSPAIYAMVIVAFLVGLAPVFHAVCIAPHGSSSQASAPMTHVMADGTVMTMSTPHSSDAMAMSSPSDTAAASSSTPAVNNNGIDAMDVLGGIMISAGITLLTLVGLRFCRQALVRGQLALLPQPLATLLPSWGQARARPPSQVNLTTLCISRT